MRNFKKDILRQSYEDFLPLSLVDSEFTSFDMVLSESSTVLVDWGDGDIEVYSGASFTISHTYSTPFSGEMKVSCLTGNEKIIEFNNFSVSNTSDSIAFTTSEIGTFTGLKIFNCIQSNIISGDIINFPDSLEQFTCYGTNTLSGFIDNLKEGLTRFHVQGNNTTQGDIANLPSTLTYYNNQGLNTTIGDISGLPSGLITYINQGNNETEGDIANLPINLQNYTNLGNNTTQGDIANLPSTLTKYWNQGNNTTTGDIVDLPNNLQFYSNFGSNTTFGDIALMPLLISYFVNRGNCEASYSTSRVWNSVMTTVYVDPTLAGRLETAEVDQMLIDLANVTNWTAISPEVKLINLAGQNQSRSATSNTAVSTLLAIPITVTTN